MSLMDQELRHKMSITDQELKAVDRCDRCGAAAMVRITLPHDLELDFCAHHFKENSAALADVAITIKYAREVLVAG